jgi:hypothetical protein
MIYDDDKDMELIGDLLDKQRRRGFSRLMISSVSA